MKKFAILTAVFTLLIIGGGIFFISTQGSQTDGAEVQSQETSLPENIEYYWGSTCPHCANVNDFIQSWDKKDEVTINKLEVYSNPGNAAAMQKRASYCKIPSNQVGVPFMFTPEGKCIVGDGPIIEYLKSL